MKYYVVTDVHGFFTELTSVLKEKGFFDDTAPKKLIVCGDLFDRGDEAKQMQEFIVDLLWRDEVVLIRGNHEDLALEFIENIDRWLTPDIFNTHHWRNGTVETLLSLTDYDLNLAICDRSRFVQKVKNTPYFKDIIPYTVNYFEVGDYIFVHGWIPCEVYGNEYKPIKYFYKKDWRESLDSDWKFARWYNGMEASWQGAIEQGKTIVCGHCRCSYGHSRFYGDGEERGENANYSPYYSEGIIALDGCTVISKKVNCIVIEI